MNHSPGDDREESVIVVIHAVQQPQEIEYSDDGVMRDRLLEYEPGVGRFVDEVSERWSSKGDMVERACRLMGVHVEEDSSRECSVENEKSSFAPLVDSAYSVEAV